MSKKVIEYRKNVLNSVCISYEQKVTKLKISLYLDEVDTLDDVDIEDEVETELDVETLEKNSGRLLLFFKAIKNVV